MEGCCSAGREHTPSYGPGSRELKQAAMASSHDTPMAGHFGQQKTLARLKTKFWWEGLEDDVRDYCSTKSANGPSR